MKVVIGKTCWDCGPFCSDECAEQRNGHPVLTRETSESGTCRNCGAWDDDDDEDAETFGDLLDYHTGAFMRPATREQRDASLDAARFDGGAGVILVDEAFRLVRPDDDGDVMIEAVRCYVSE